MSRFSAHLFSFVSQRHTAQRILYAVSAVADSNRFEILTVVAVFLSFDSVGHCSSVGGGDGDRVFAFTKEPCIRGCERRSGFRMRLTRVFFESYYFVA